MSAGRTLAEWLEYQSRLHPREIELGLERIRTVWKALGAPRPAPRVISVAGTNGKGSTVAFLEAMLEAAGYRTGCYTSPHLLRYNERIRIAGTPVGDELLCDAFERIETARSEVPLTYFEFGTLAAFLCLAGAGLDVAILEVGLGGRLDAVNLLDADVAVITGIALDHTEWLGENLERIGREKAGIARAGRPLVYAAPRMPDSIAEAAQEKGASLRRLGRDYAYRRTAGGWEWRMGARLRSGLPLPAMRGEAQLRNAAGALAALALLPDVSVSQAAVRSGLLAARVPGRFEVRQRGCPWVLDVAHNPEAAAVLAAQLAERPLQGRRHAVVGMLADKAIGEVLATLAPRVDRWHLLDLSATPRGASAEMLREALPPAARGAADCWADLGQGLAALVPTLGPEDEVLVFGSFVTVGQAMQWMGDGDTAASARSG